MYLIRRSERSQWVIRPIDAKIAGFIYIVRVDFESQWKAGERICHQHGEDTGRCEEDTGRRTKIQEGARKYLKLISQHHESSTTRIRLFSQPIRRKIISDSQPIRSKARSIHVVYNIDRRYNIWWVDARNAPGMETTISVPYRARACNLLDSSQLH